MQSSEHPSLSKVPFDTEEEISLQALQGLYKDMLLIRRFEERAGQLYGMGHIGGFCHLYIGQEAVVVGIQAALSPSDTVITAYRDHGHMLACGMDPRGVMAELTGRIGGYSKGKGGSMHMFSREKGFFGGHGIVGAQVPLGTGLAFSHQYLGDGGLCVVYLGDGAMNQGQVYESFNMASLWKLPVLYVIENNGYAMGTSATRASAGGPFHRRGEPFAIPGSTVEGMDVLAVRKAALDATARIRSGEGPFILEMMTYRYRGHSMSDPGKYRSKEEVDTVKKERDPLAFCHSYLQARGLKEEDFNHMEKEVKAVVVGAAAFSLESPEPDPQELWTDVVRDAAS